MKYLIYVFLLFFVLNACEDTGAYAYETDAGIGRGLQLIKADTLINHQWGNGYSKLTKGRFLIYHSIKDIDTFFVALSTKVIEPHIISMKVDSNYIIIDQKPLDLIFERTNEDDYYSYNDNMPDNRNERDKIIKQSPIHRYWILDKHSNHIYGGYKRTEFDSVRKKLKLPEKMDF